MNEYANISQGLPPSLVCFSFDTAQDYDERLLKAVGELRYNAWNGIGMSMNSADSEKVFIDEYDENAHIWVVTNKTGQMVASARVSIHDSIDSIPQVELFNEYRACLKPPIAAFSRLVVSAEYRNQKISNFLVEQRLAYVEPLEVNSISVICPAWKAKNLKKFGFVQLGEPKPTLECPSVIFAALAMEL
jgi:predicted GNAT family N-acyltransferase